jgi:phage gp46-like protein
MADIPYIFNTDSNSWDWPDPSVLCSPTPNSGDLRSAVINSLMSYGQTPPDSPGNPYGVWFDIYETENTGSRLHMLLRGTFVDALPRTYNFAKTALAHLINDGVVDHFDINVGIIGQSAVGLQVIAYAPTLKTPETFNYSLYWIGVV